VSVVTPASAEAARNLDALRRQLAEAPEAGALKPLGLGGIVLGRGAVASVPALVAELRNGGVGEVAVVADCRPMAGGVPDLKASIVSALERDGVAVHRITIGDEHARVHADAPTIDGAVEGVAGATVVVSIGSGSVVDVAKAVAARTALPHVAVQTAASVNGFADDQSVLLVDGVKRTTATAWPDRLVIDVDVIAQAPAELNRAGLGDLLASYTAPADWLLASLVGQDDSYSSIVVDLTRRYVDSALTAADGIGRGDADAIEDLAGTLTLSGISMGVAGRTAPGSGMEHTVSHLLEMSQPPGDVEPLHGAKVGALSVLSALLWERVRAAVRDGALARLRFPAADEMQARVEAAFAPLDPSGATAHECWRDYSRKLERWRAAAPALATLHDRWPAFDGQLDRILVPTRRLIAALVDSGAPTRLADLGIDGPRLRWAIANCHLMRDRFTVADLAFFLGIFEAEHVDALLADAAALGAGA
jgi:glycerol-1-phosphate dehydrogenase [NAD(P)+]